jgi:hypothetical protein
MNCFFKEIVNDSHINQSPDFERKARALRCDSIYNIHRYAFVQAFSLIFYRWQRRLDLNPLNLRLRIEDATTLLEDTTLVCHSQPSKCNFKFSKCLKHGKTLICKTHHSTYQAKGLFTRPISERDFAVSYSLLQNIIIFIFNKMGYPNAKSDPRVNRP